METGEIEHRSGYVMDIVPETIVYSDQPTTFIARSVPLSEREQNNKRDEVLRMFQNLFEFHNEANKGYKGIDDLFNKWWETAKNNVP